MNLLDTTIFSDVVYFIATTDDRTIEILIIAKDIWSLKVSTKPSGGGGVYSLLISENENNFLGLNKNLSLDQGFDTFYDSAKSNNSGNPSMCIDYFIGQSYLDRRFLGTKHILLEKSRFYFSEGKKTGDSYLINLYYPLHRRTTKWGYSVSSSYSNRIYRLLEKGGTQYYPDFTNETNPKATIVRLKTIDADSYIVRSFGYENKFNILFGIRVFNDEYGNALDTLGSLRDYEDKTSYYFYNVLRFFNNYDYKKIINFNNYGLWEYVPEGFNLSLQTTYSDKEIGSYDTYLAFYFYSLYQFFYFNNSLFRISYAQQYVIDNGIVGKADGRYTKININNHLNLFGFGSFVFQSDYSQVLPNSSNGKISKLRYGGSIDIYPEVESYKFYDRTSLILRGYPKDYFEGIRALLFNIEFRTNPVYLLSSYVGAVIFTDSLAIEDIDEDDSDSIATISTLPKIKDLNDFNTSAGIGLRILLPQFNRSVLRVDFAMPIRESNPLIYGEKQFSFGFFQVF